MTMVLLRQKAELAFSLLERLDEKMKMTLGQKIAENRRVAGLTQEALAEKMGVSAQAVSKWEKDVSCPDITLLPSLAKLFETSIDELLSGESSELVAYVPKETRKSLDDLVLYVLVESSDGDEIKVNLPFPLIMRFVEMGLPAEKMFKLDGLGNIDLETIIRMVEAGAIGRIVEVNSADGDKIIVEVR